MRFQLYGSVAMFSLLKLFFVSFHNLYLYLWLQFEWAWQHPERSRRLRDAVAKKKTKENRFDFSLRVLSHMLSTGPWCRLALTIQWLKPAYAVDFDPSMLPPPHMPIQYGPVVPKKATPQSELAETSYGCCTLCKKQLSAADRLTCINSGCSMESHIICLATNFLKSEPAEIVPLEGQCPKCKQSYLWADLIRKLQGCYQQDPSDN